MTNRTYSKTLALSEKLNCLAMILDKLYGSIMGINIVFAATTTLHTKIKKNL